MRIRSAPHRDLLLLILIIVSLAGLPLLGVVLNGQPLALYLEFPPLTHHVQHAPFSWPVFLGLALLIAAGLAPCVWRVIAAISSYSKPTTETSPFPLWGWLGVLFIAPAWWLAWTRYPWFAALQPFTFTPLWFGYIVVINALTSRATRTCLLVDRPRYLLVLFLLSAAFWWCFEYLNRFVQNWYYVGIEQFSPSVYVFHATLSFSTVLPAVVSTVEWLKSSQRLDSAFRHLTAISVSHPALIGGIVCVLAGTGLMGIGVWPNALFPLLWVSPLLLITSLQAMLGRATIFSGIRHGDWRPICLPALAGLQCGFFWELWNWHSLVFLLSAAFWWCFEYLNRFVQNWYYVGIEQFSPSVYVFHATLSFSTVLPAVVSTVEWLKSSQRLDSAFRHLTAISVSHPALIGGIVCVLAGTGLMGIGVWPNALFPLLWVSPLLLITSLQAMLGRATIFSGIRHGDWRPICLPALAGLQCGFFWELWNWHSLAHWEYAIPYVHRFLMFEMPLLGYGGYLPFGLECLVVANLFKSRNAQ